MSNLHQEIANLSPEERELFELLLKKEGMAEMPILPQSGSVDLPLSSVQERLWFIDQLIPYSAAYNVPRIIHSVGALNVEALQKSFGEIIRRHEILRVTCSTVEGKPQQRLCPAKPFDLPLIDLREPPAETRRASPELDERQSRRASPEQSRRTEAERLANKEVQRPIDLGQSPLLRCVLFRLDDEEYMLVLTTHHYVADAPGMELLMNELALLYKAFSNGDPSPLAELTVQYADYAYRQRRQQQIKGEVAEKQLAYWKKQLAGAIQPLQLPTDRPRPAVFSYRGKKRWFDLPPALAKAIKQLGQAEGATIFMTLLAAFQTLLYRYTGQTKIVVGTIVSERSRVGADNLIGSFTNNLALTANLSGNPTFRALLEQIRAMAPTAYANQDLPFENLVEALQPERDLSRPPLFQAMFSNHEGTVFKKIEFNDLTWAILPFDQKGARFDLSLEIQGWDTGQPRGYIEYSDDLFDETTIERMCGHFLTLLQSIVTDPAQRISELDWLTEAERQQLLVTWNNTRQEIPKVCLHHLFEKQAAQTPEAVALQFETEQLSYRELNQRANQLARHLQLLGVGPGTLVGICLERSLEMMVGLLGILKAGGAYIPLDPTYPRERLAFILADTRSPLILTQRRLQSVLPNHKASVICLDAEWETISRQKQERPPGGAAPDDLAYVIHTSGSTGQPKGVQISHRAVVNFLQAMRREPGLNEQDTLLAVTTLSFDISALELFLPLSVGARLVIAGRETATDGAQLAKQMATAGVTAMQATPATWRMLLESGWQGDGRLKILCGGETLPRSLADQLLQKGGSLWNLYGPTETTIWSTIERVSSGKDTIVGGPVSIGRPIANTQLYLLDSQLEPVPIGVYGELYIGGAGLAQGYLNQPELTAEKFIPNPFLDFGLSGSGSVLASPVFNPKSKIQNPKSKGRLYKTGDVARYLPDGRLEFLGRNDCQVKIRGFRVELGEIEAALARHPAVQAAAVAVHQTAPDSKSPVVAADKRLVAYLIPGETPIPPINELRRFLREKLPDYMIPAAVVEMDALPLTPNGKLDRQALPAPDGSRPELAASFVAAQTPAEKKLAEIWADILNVERVGINDNFFDLGGHSLLAVQLISRLRDTFQIEAPLRLVFKNPTIAEQALAIEDMILAEMEQLTEAEALSLL